MLPRLQTLQTLRTPVTPCSTRVTAPRRTRLLIAAVAALAASAIAVGSADPARAFDWNSTPAETKMMFQNTAQIDEAIAEGWRPTSIETDFVNNNQPYFSVVYVRNTGSHYRQVKFLGNTTTATIDGWRGSGWRIEDVAVTGGKLSALLVRNVSDPRTTGYFFGWSVTDLSNWTQANPSWRLLDLDAYSAGGQRYAGVVIRNTGSAAVAGWGWHPGMTLPQADSWSRDNGMRVIDLDRRSDGKYAVVFVKSAPFQRYYCFGSQDLGWVFDFVNGAGLRLQSLSMTRVGNRSLFSGVAVNNVSTQAARLADLTLSEHRGYQGYYLRQVDGPTLVDMNAHRVMHPSSTIKILLHFAAIQETHWTDLGYRTIGGRPMQDVLSKMMWYSNNSMANLVVSTLGGDHIEDIGRDDGGMSINTQMRNTFGSGGPYSNANINTTTLYDLGRLYETIQSGVLHPAKYNFLRDNMLNHTNSAPWKTIFPQVRDQLGLTSSEYAEFKAGVRHLVKAGNNHDPDTGANGYWSSAGVLVLPRRVNGQTEYREYVFGHFVNQSSKNYDDGWRMTAELLREQIVENMATFN